MALLMNFMEPYLLAMRERAPAMFNDLRKHGRLDQHLKEMSARAHQMLRELLAPYPEPTLAQKREAEETVLATLIEFPPERPAPGMAEPPDDLKPISG